MGIGEKVKDVYYAGEEKWYGVLDSIDEHIPIYKIIDPIDGIVPSFALFLIVLLLLILFFAWGFVGGGIGGPQNGELKLSVVDSQGNSVTGAQVTIDGNTYYTNEFGLIPDQLFFALGSVVEVTAEKGKARTVIPIPINESQVIKEIKLGSVSFSEARTIRFMTETGTTVDKQINLNFHCSNTSATAPDPIGDIYSGNVNVDVPSDCGTLTATVTSPFFKVLPITIMNPTNVVTLVSNQSTTKVTVTVRVSEGTTLISQPVTVQAYSTDNLNVAKDSTTTVNGTATFDLYEGDYQFKTVQENGFKSSGFSSTKTIAVGGPTTVDLTVTHNYVGAISVRVNYGGDRIADARVVLTKDKQEIQVQASNATTDLNFMIAENGVYVVEAWKDGYCTVAQNAAIGDSVVISLSRDVGQCGGTMSVRVVDGDNRPVQFAKVVLFKQVTTENGLEDQKVSAYPDRLTDLNGFATFNAVGYTTGTDMYKVFAYKAIYSGWSVPTAFTVRDTNTNYLVTLQIPSAKVNVTVKDTDGLPVQFAEVQVFENYGNRAITGKKYVEDQTGVVTFDVKADKSVYAVIKKDGYESYTTEPKEVSAAGAQYSVVLSKPPVDALKVRFLGFYKNDLKALSVQANEEYTALFEVTSPKSYDELGLFFRVGRDDITKTEMDKLYIKSVDAPGIDTIITGASYNKPNGYSTDAQFLNLEESKWGEVVWGKGYYVPGKIIVASKVKIKETAQLGDTLWVGYRAWGVMNGAYERDVADDTMGTAVESSQKQELYAATKEEPITVGQETLCDESTGNKFCITATYTDTTDTSGFIYNFNDGFDAKNNTAYKVKIDIMSASKVTFDQAKIKIENPEENLQFGDYTLVTPTYTIKTGTVNAYKTDWIETPSYAPNSIISISSLMVTPRKTGTGTIKVSIGNGNQPIFDKVFTVSVSSDKKMIAQYLTDGEFKSTMQAIVSGKTNTVTLKVLNSVNSLEVDGAHVKLYDRFGTLLYETTTNKVGVATIQIPAALPSDKMTIKVENPEYETLVIDFAVSKDIVNVTPANLSFTVNPQTTPSDSKSVKIENKTGIDLTIKKIALTGKLKGLLSESQINTYFNSFVGMKIPSQDFIEVNFKVFVAKVIPQADDLDGTFEITVGADGKEWVKEVVAKIRVGLGKDVDDPNCLEVTKNTWNATSQGGVAQMSLDIKNNCLVAKKLVDLKLLSGKVELTGNSLGAFNVKTDSAQAELSRAYVKTIMPTIGAGATIPITLTFTPYGGANGTTTGKIQFSAENATDSKAQQITTAVDFSINVINLKDCISLGADLVKIDAGKTGQFAVSNLCGTQADITVEGKPLQFSTKQFSLKGTTSTSTDFGSSGGTAGSSGNESTKDVTINTTEGDVLGAYNVIVYARQGNSASEVVGNVKVIINDPTSCFELTRYEYDVYRTIATDINSGIDRGYLKNNCTQKQVSAKVSGTIPYDSSAFIRSLLIGGLAGAASGISQNGFECTSGWMTGKKCTPPNGQNLSTAVASAGTELVQGLTAASASVPAYIGQKATDLDTITKLADPKTNNAAYKTCTAYCAVIDKNATDACNDIESAKVEACKADVKNIVATNCTSKCDTALDNFTKATKEQSGKVASLKTDAESQYKSFISQTNSSVDAAKVKANAEVSLGTKSRETVLNEINDIHDQAETQGKTISESAVGKINSQLQEAKKTITSVNTITVDTAPIVTALKALETKYPSNVEEDTLPYTPPAVSAFPKNLLIAPETALKTLDDRLQTPTTFLGWKLWSSTPYAASTTSGSTTSSNPATGAFLLATTVSTSNSSSSSSSLGGLGTALQFGMNNITAIGGGFMSGNLLSGLLWGAAQGIMQAKDTPVEYTDYFNVNLAEITDVSLDSPDGITMSMGKSSYDYSTANGHMQTTLSTSSVNESTASTNSASGVLYNSSSLSATLGLTEYRELTFTGNGKMTKTPYSPYEATLTVNGKEKVYNTSYDYSVILAKAKAAGTYTTSSSSGFLGGIRDILVTPTTTVADMDANFLTVKSTRTFEKKFHLLFNSYEYVDCGPGSTAGNCKTPVIGNCEVGSKLGSTGTTAVPRILLNWDWSTFNNAPTMCDNENPNSIYCDTTQFTMTTLSKLATMKTFFSTGAGSTMDKCPKAIDVASTNSQKLAANDLDVGITAIHASETSDGALIEATVSTNNGLPMDATVAFTLKRQDGTSVDPKCTAQTKNFTSETTFSCSVKTADIGQGSFNLTATLSPTLCTGCQNNDTSNDTISSMLIIGGSGLENCQGYDTRKDAFERVLAANGLLSGSSGGNAQARTVLGYTSFTANLVRDGFSKDFKDDLDAYLMKLTVAPPAYLSLRDLFLSDKFKVTWPNQPEAWTAGKYLANLIVTFDGNSWNWNDNNAIKSVELKLEPWGPPEKADPFYNFGFDGSVGADSSNGRVGYGVYYTNLAEGELTIASAADGTAITTKTNPTSLAITNLNFTLDKSFYNLNSVRKGNLLTVDRTGDEVNLSFAPSTPVPLILNITRNTAQDAYAFYNATVNGQQVPFGTSFLQWKGIGQGCVDFRGESMQNWDNILDQKDSASQNAYGFRWNNADHAGTVSLYTVAYSPADAQTLFQITTQSESANFQGANGETSQLITVAKGTSTVSTLQDVFDNVAKENVCVIGGEYFWNNKVALEPLAATITAKESTCIPRK